jgi:primosomal protein N' (replication factor Y) (superfamily II helicase)
VKIAHVALDVPLEEAFDFLVPEGLAAPVGSLVVVPFARTRKVGVVVALAEGSRVPAERLRSIESVVADIPPIADAELELYDFCARYYQRPLGEVLGTVLPPRLRQVARRPLAAPGDAGGSSPRLVEALALTQEQREAITLCNAEPDAFRAVLLQGVTGSGKTEVYLHLIAKALAAGRQALFLVPEIGLTPQFEAQVRERFPDATLVAAHSHLNEGERAAAWLAAQSGAAHIVLGTRLAVLMPFRRLGLIVVDEEHDLSYKQQEGLRYSARDIAVRRAQRLGIPVILGSATPSLESFANAREGRYGHASLTQRAASGSAMPAVRTVDTRADRPHEGLSHALVEAIRGRLAKKEQSLIFVNRRGFSPVLYCRACAWHSTCKRCSANLVVHLGAREMRCHHCGHRSRIPAACPGCGAADLAPIGHGTQRVEDTLVALFPEARIARVDRDSTSRKGSLRGLLEKVRKGEIDILVGTQMLAKGHDYPKLTLVGVLDCDSALFSADFRASERLFSQLVQVSGRAGRGEAPGEVLIQTDFPGHPLFAAVARQDFTRFAADALAERQLAGFPPFSHLALLRAESKKAGEATVFLKLAARLAKRLAARLPAKDVEVFDAVPAPLERKAGYERAQLLVRAVSRATLQPFLHEWKSQLVDKGGRHVRWSLDVDPQEV